MLKKRLFFYFFISIVFSYSIHSTEFQRAIDLDPAFVSQTVRSMAGHAYRDSVLGMLDYQDVPKTKFSFLQFNETLYYKYLFHSQLNLPFIGERIDTLGCVYRRDNQIFVVFHGSTWLDDWIYNAQAMLVPCQNGPVGRAHKGFYDLLDSCFQDMLQAMKSALSPQNEELVRSYAIINNLNIPPWDWTNREFDFIFTGHSLGGALATLAGSRFVHLSQMEHTQLGHDLSPEGTSSNQFKIITFSAPRIGDKELIKNIHIKINPCNILRFLCTSDIVPKVPPKLIGYEDIGWSIEMSPLEHIVDKTKVGIDYIFRGNGVQHRMDVLRRIGEFTYGSLRGGTILIKATGGLLLFSAEELIDRHYLTSIAGFGSQVIMILHEIPTRETISRALSQTKLEEELKDEMDLQKGPGVVSFWSINRNPFMKFIDSFI